MRFRFRRTHRCASAMTCYMILRSNSYKTRRADTACHPKAPILYSVLLLRALEKGTQRRENRTLNVCVDGETPVLTI